MGEGERRDAQRNSCNNKRKEEEGVSLFSAASRGKGKKKKSLR